MPLITVQVSQDVAKALHKQSPPTAEAKELLSALKKLDLALTPLDSDARDPNLSTFFSITVTDNETANRVIARLEKLSSIKAAYVKPPAELP